MILTEKIKIKITRKNIDYFIKKGYLNIKLKDIINIKTVDLQRNSQRIIKVKCDICGEKKDMKYQTYMNSYENCNIYSCNKCKEFKSKKTKLKVYGDKNFNNRKKSKKTNLEKYGVENVSQSEKIKNLKKQTSVKNWGVENVFQNEKIIEKSKNTKLEKYDDENYTNREKCWETCELNFGVKYPTQSLEVLEKRNKNNLNKFGKEHYTQTEQYKKRVKKTCLEKYNVEYYMMSDEFKEKSKKSMLERYGVEYASQSNEILTKIKKTKIKNGSYLSKEQIQEYIKYQRKVRNLTKKNIVKLFDNWDGTDYYDNEYIANNYKLKHTDKNFPTIDHKISIYYGFHNNIDENIIANLENLCITKSYINSSKNRKTEEEYLK